MVRDITLGQYLPGKSVIHRLVADDAGIIVGGTADEDSPDDVPQKHEGYFVGRDFHGHYQSVLRYGRCVVGMGHYPHYTRRYP